ncbi:MAG: aminotransferase class I/II-fold pyridoxal phosphate-dependent enzyme [Pseudomonadota bacterium]|nr:aminotransferase class I/II-fold pyridoxal phosphate-dependent enzyme [Pseudomonadota bacterium]
MEMEKYLNDALYGAKHSAIREFSNLAAKTPGCVALTLGEPDFDTPEEVREEVNRALSNHETHYIMNNGIPALRKRIAEKENLRLGRHYTEQNVIVTAGAEEGVFLSLFGILNPGDEVIVPTPAFVIYEEITKLCRGTFVPMDISSTDFQIDKVQLEALITPKTKAIVLNSPNNPTGCVLNSQSLQAVVDVVKDRDIFVIADDVYQQLTYTEDCHSIGEYTELGDKLILVQSFSKPYAMTGWRMGYICVSEALRERLELVHQFMITSTPAPFQRAALRALDVDITPYLNTYGRRREYMLQRLSQMGMKVVEPEGAFYVFPSIAKWGIPSGSFCRRMIQEVGLAATPGFAFGSDDHIRLTYCYSDENLKEGLDRLEKFLHILDAEKENGEC